MSEVERQLGTLGVPVVSIQERDGVDANFYERRKLTSDVNLVRTLRFFADFIEASSGKTAIVVLVDRGPFDALCWTRWCALQSSVSQGTQRIVADIFESVSEFADKYRVIWMDRDPLQALRSHGAQPGRIVNFQNLVSLRGVYEETFAALRTERFTGLQVISDDGTAQQIASQLIQQLKLNRPAATN